MAGVLDRLDAGAVRRWARDALDRLGSHRDEIDGLNVYPVPDGDTGTNLYLTVESAVAAVDQVPDDDGLPEVADALATGALHGARGSSGVILSQVLKGWAEALREHPDGGARAVRAALVRAADSAYAAVSRPSEGTMLSVARAAAEGAGRGGGNLRDVVSGALSAARSALDRTPGQLDALGRAGVVDAGGRGLLLVLESLAGTVTGRRAARGPSGPGEDWGAGPSAAEPETQVLGPSLGPASERSAEASVGEGFPFEVMYLVDAPEAAVGPLRDRLERLGESVVVVGGASSGAVGTWKVHVHAADVAGVLAVGAEAGPLRQVRVAPVHPARSSTNAPGAPSSQAPDAPSWQAPAAPTSAGAAPQQRVSVVAVAAGAGPAGLLAAAGALVVVRDENGLAPGELFQAVRDACTGAVVVLPDNADTAAAAAEAAAGVEAQQQGRCAAVLPPCAPVQALAALAVHDPGDPLPMVVERMSATAGATRHGVVAPATRHGVVAAGMRHGVVAAPEQPARTPAGPCPRDLVGRVGGEVVATGPDALDVARAVADRLLEGGGELVTVLSDAGPEAAEVARNLCAHLHDARPDLEVHAVDGGAEGDPDGALLMLGAE